MKVIAPVPMLLLVALCCGPGRSSRRWRPMWYYSDPKTWEEARDHCRREHKGDLMTVLSQAELDLMDLSSYHAWVGRVPHNDHSHAGSHKGQCGLACYQQQMPQSVDCSDYHFFFCSGPFSDVFVPQAMTWTEAESACEGSGQPMTTYSAGSHLRWPGSPVYVPREFPVWVGLNCRGGSWSWSDGQLSDYRNWRPDLGSAPSSCPCLGCGRCVSVGSQSKSMSNQLCDKAFPFLCYKPSLVLLRELLTWEQAVEHCKDLSSSSSFRLLTVDQSHMETIKNVLRFKQTNKVWVGLRFLAGSWFWLDGAPLSVPPLLPCPDSTLGCAALVVSSGSDPVIEPCDCSEKLNLLCYNPPL